MKRPANIRLYAGTPQRRKQFDGLLPVCRHGIEILFQEIGAEPRRYPVLGKELEPFGALVWAEHQPIALLADIAFNAFIPQDRHLGQALLLALDQLRNGIRDPILMYDRDRRDLQPEHGAGLPCIISRRADDMLASDFTAIGHDLPLAARHSLKAAYFGIEIDLGAAVARTFRHRLRHICRCDMAIIGIIKGAQHPFALHERPELQHLSRCQELGSSPLRFRHAHIAFEFIEPVFAVGEAQLAAFVPSDTLPGIRFKPLIDLDRLGDHAADIEVPGIGRHQAGGVPGRAGGQLRAFKQRDVRPASSRQAIENPSPYATATNDHRSRMSLHLASPH